MFDFPMPQQLTLFIRAKINPIDDKKQQTMISKPILICLILLICQERINPRPAQISSVSLIYQQKITLYLANTFNSITLIC